MLIILVSFYQWRYENREMLPNLRPHSNNIVSIFHVRRDYPFLLNCILFVSFIIYSSHLSWIQLCIWMISHVLLAKWFILVEWFLNSISHHLESFTLVIYINIIFIKQMFICIVCALVFCLHTFMCKTCVYGP